jgi:thiol-disulfide isomerase/thioredoxin
LKTSYTLPAQATRVSILISIIIAAAAFTSRADKAPDSINTIQSLLPDSVSLNNKVVYVDFWASWCTPCRHSFPWMQEMYDKYHGRGLEIVAVNVDKDHGAAMDFLHDTKVTFPIVFDSTGQVAKEFKLEAMPTSFVFSRDGRMVTRNRGFRQEETDSLDYALSQLLVEGRKK